jgi:putative membrane-bound dehydrogenase-like protein
MRGIHFKSCVAYLVLTCVCSVQQSLAAPSEAYLFTPQGFQKEGTPIVLLDDSSAGRLHITVRDAATGRPTCCRINVVGPDGNFYQPKINDLSRYTFTLLGWPKDGLGNREGKGPFRYYGRFFYSRGQADLLVPPGNVRIEVWKGFEYRPQSLTTRLAKGQQCQVELTVARALDMADYHSGDPHLHFRRQGSKDDDLILDLLEAEDIHFGSVLAFNDPAGPYAGFMDKLQAPQRGVGKGSIHKRGDYWLLSGQEYRSSQFGHMNLYLRNNLALAGSSLNADDGPPYGHVARETRKQGGYALYAHGGYGQAIYADFAQGDLDAVELLQFAEYRGIGLEDWYRILNIGYRLPCTGASDYPACRALGDCRTFVYLPDKPDFESWLRGAMEGRSFVTTGPLLFLDVNGRKPGGRIELAGAGPHTLTVHARVFSTVAPVTNLQLIVNGKVVEELVVPASQGINGWLDLTKSIPVSAACWVAARAFSRSPQGLPDANAHTNPVYVYRDGKAPFDSASLDVLVQRLEAQMTAQARRTFQGKTQVLDYFQESRRVLRKVQKAGGLPVGGITAFLKTETSDTGFNPAARTHTETELGQFLKPLPPKPPAEALKTFSTVPGFHMEMLAHEPMVHSPVAGAFDENGNLYIAEMIDYPYMPKAGKKPLGRVRLLIDRNGDGIFDEAHVFADGLYAPSGIVPWQGGIFVVAAPDLWYFKDTRGRHKADVRRRIFTGFADTNPQGCANNLIFGLDHKIYGSTSVNGGKVRTADQPEAPVVDINGRDFRFDPVTLKFETITGTAQFGNTFDDWGNRFMCTESNPVFHVVLPQRYLARNPYLPVPSALNNLAPGPVPVFRTSPVEHWRMIRSGRRIAYGERPATSPGASHNVVDAGAGVVVYRGGAYPPAYYGTVFTADPQNNLIHHRTLVPDGVTFRSERVEDKSEFVRSSDNWFRPVNLLNAPDGTLYALDMGREILEAIHIPLDLLKYLDLRSGRDHGRIYRIAPSGFKYPGPPLLGKANGKELVRALESLHGWWRETAHRLIFERQDAALVQPLRRLLAQSALPQARLHALYSLAGLNALSDQDLALALADTKPALREHAVRLAEPRQQANRALREMVYSLADDANARVAFQVAFTLGEVRDLGAAPVLARLARRQVADHWIATAVLSSVADSADRLLVELLHDPAFAASRPGAELIGQLAEVVGVRNHPHELERVLQAAAGATPGVRDALVLVLGEGLKRSGGRLPVAARPVSPAEKLIAELMADAKATANNGAAPEGKRQQAIRLVACGPLASAREVLAGQLDPRQPDAVQAAAVRALASYDHPSIAGILLAPWNQYPPAVRDNVVHTLLSRVPWTVSFLQAVADGKASAQQVDPVRRDALLKHRNAAVAALAKKVLGASASNPRKQVLDDYAAALKLKADAQRGHAVFQKTCMVCHRINNEGTDVGPNLTASNFRDPAALMTQILDPNLYVSPQYIQYLVVDQSGRTFTGILSQQTATSITLRRDKGAEDTILRSHIDEITSTGKSLMPEGLEKQVSKQDMADLLYFLIEAQASSGPLDRGTEPVNLVEPP